MAENGEIGKILWHDLTVPDAEGARDFYAAVVGWKHEPVPVGDYQDYSMQAENGDTVGVCHARGQNAGVPAQWLMYVKVKSVAESIAAATSRGGTVVHGPRKVMGAMFAILRDPAGAVIGIME